MGWLLDAHMGSDPAHPGSSKPEGQTEPSLGIYSEMESWTEPTEQLPEEELAQLGVARIEPLAFKPPLFACGSSA